MPRGQEDELGGLDDYRCLEHTFPHTSYRRNKKDQGHKLSSRGAGCQWSPEMPETSVEWTHTGQACVDSESLGSGLRTGLGDHTADLPVCQSLWSSKKCCDLSWGYWVKVT